MYVYAVYISIQALPVCFRTQANQRCCYKTTALLIPHRKQKYSERSRHMYCFVLQMNTWNFRRSCYFSQKLKKSILRIFVGYKQNQPSHLQKIYIWVRKFISPEIILLFYIGQILNLKFVGKSAKISCLLDTGNALPEWYWKIHWSREL